jgi:hypothetical protein
MLRDCLETNGLCKHSLTYRISPVTVSHVLTQTIGGAATLGAVTKTGQECEYHFRWRTEDGLMKGGVDFTMKLPIALFLLTVLCAAQTFVATPISDLGTGTYLKQFEGGLYENGTNAVPLDHDTLVRVAAAQIIPRNSNGVAFSRGKIVFASLGVSYTKAIWCGQFTPCISNSFMDIAPSTNPALVYVDGSTSSPLEAWLPVSSPNWQTVIDHVKAAGASANQVQVVWMSYADSVALYPAPSLPDRAADAYATERNLGIAIRNARVWFPQLKVIFLTSVYYQTHRCTTTYEPYAYESGFSYKWLIQAQVNQERTGIVDSIAGDLSLGVAPKLVWGSYMWADGIAPRLDGFTWNSEDVLAQSPCHPSPSGVTKTADLLLNFMRATPYGSGWLY